MPSVETDHIIFLLYIFGAGAASRLDGSAVLILTVVYLGFYFWLLSGGTTPGKMALGEQVVEKLNGGYPGFWRMVLREVIGKAVSGLFLGPGFAREGARAEPRNLSGHVREPGDPSPRCTARPRLVPGPVPTTPRSLTSRIRAAVGWTVSTGGGSRALPF